jgi:hypothetical protein
VPVLHDEAVHHGPGSAGRAGCYLLAFGDDLRQDVLLAAELIEELELRPGDGVDAPLDLLFVTARKGICSCICAPGLYSTRKA